MNINSIIKILKHIEKEGSDEELLAASTKFWMNSNKLDKEKLLKEFPEIYAGL